MSRVKAAEKAAAKAEAKKVRPRTLSLPSNCRSDSFPFSFQVGKSPIVVPDSEDDRSDGEKSTSQQTQFNTQPTNKVFLSFRRA